MSGTRIAIRAAAQRLFAEKGYARTSVRDIAAEARADPAMVIRHFGSKESLFLDTMQVELDPVDALAGDLSTLGERFVRMLLDSQEDVRGAYLALLRASDSDGVHTRLREAHRVLFVEPLAARLTGPDAEVRARLAAAVVGGLLSSLWVVGDESLAALDPDVLARRYGALVQAAIEGSCGERASRTI